MSIILLYTKIFAHMGIGALAFTVRTGAQITKYWMLCRRGKNKFWNVFRIQVLFFCQNECNAVSIISTEPQTINYATLSAKKANISKNPWVSRNFKTGFRNSYTWIFG